MSKLPLTLLSDLARERVEDAERHLAVLSAAKLSADLQLSTLYDYRQDYVTRLQAAMTYGMAVSDCQNYQRFITTLDGAIHQQSEAVSGASTQLQTGRHQWHQARLKLNSFDALAQRQNRARAKVEHRREQQQNDESAARLWQRQIRST
jgi:flagellar FliJ protein